MEEIETEYTKFIRDQLIADKDADDIIENLLGKFTDINAFKSALCDKVTNECVFISLDKILEKGRIFGQILQTPQNKNRKTQFWRLRSKITTICQSGASCSINELTDYFKYLKNAKDHAATTYGSMDIDAIITQLSGTTIQRGGNQKGGDLLQIVTLLAGIDNVVSRISEVPTQSYNGLRDLCKKAADAISAIPGCLRSIMGDTLYALVKNIVKGAIGAGAMRELYNSGDVFLAVLNSIVKYLPYVAGSVVFYGTGLAFFKLTEKIATIIPSINTDLQTKFADAVETIDESTLDDIVNKMTEMQNAVVKKIQTKLKNASDTEKENIKNAMVEFNTDFRTMFEHLGPEANAEVAAKMAEITTNSEAMVKTIKANLEATQKKKDIWNQGAQKAADERAAAAKIEADERAAAAKKVVDERAAAEKKVTDLQAARELTLKALTDPNRSQKRQGKLAIKALNISDAEKAKQEKLLAEIVNNRKVARQEQLMKKRLEEKNDANAMDTNDLNGGKPRRKTTRKPHKKPHKKSRKHRRSRKH